MSSSDDVRHVTFGDMRLTRALQDRGMRYATLDEYAKATGMSITELLAHMKEHVQAGDLAYETVGDQAFLMTQQPAGKPRGLPRNLWETLRSRNEPDAAYILWRLGRDLEHAGWTVNYDPETVAGRKPPLSLPLKDGEAPLVLFPEPSRLTRSDGPLSRFEAAEKHVCAITCRNRQIDRTVTAVRSWYLSRKNRTSLTTLVLEEPHYQPVRIDAQDGSHTPRSSSINLESRDSRVNPA